MSKLKKQNLQRFSLLLKYLLKNLQVTITMIGFVLAANNVSAAKLETAIFAGGCFWCVESLYQEVEGVTRAVSGFTGGTLKNPTYRGNHRGHYESVKVTYDATIVSYQDLLDLFWINIDPFDNRGQFCDKGPSYRSAIFVSGQSERDLAEAGKQKVMADFGEKAVTEILPRSKFYPVEKGHQDYYLKNPIRYKFYRHGCGRDNRLEEIWGAAASH